MLRSSSRLRAWPAERRCHLASSGLGLLQHRLERLGLGHGPIFPVNRIGRQATEQFAPFEEGEEAGKQFDFIARDAADDVFGAQFGRMVQARCRHQLAEGALGVAVELVDPLRFVRHHERTLPQRILRRDAGGAFVGVARLGLYAAAVPPSAPSTTMKSGVMPVFSMALTIANHSQGWSTHSLKPTGLPPDSWRSSGRTNSNRKRRLPRIG